MVGIVELGAAVMLLGLAPTSLFSLAVIGIFLTGFAIPITNGLIGALLRSVIRRDMQGRVDVSCRQRGHSHRSVWVIDRRSTFRPAWHPRVVLGRRLYLSARWDRGILHSHCYECGEQ